MAQQYKNACCRRALLFGMLFTKGQISDGAVKLNLENEKIAAFAGELASVFTTEPLEVSTPERGGRCRVLTLNSKALSKHINEINSGNDAFVSKCSMCRSAFLKGVFLSSGRVSDPEKQYRLEFSPAYRVDELKKLFADLGLDFFVANQKGKQVLYTGRSSVIEDFFAEAGMNSTAFEFMNVKIKGELKNSVNRIRNCETNNIGKSVSASVRQSEAIEALEKANLLSMLPEELEKTARMRLKFRDYSLSRLAAEFSPPISKPGLSHRLNKIVEMADAMLKRKEK